MLGFVRTDDEALVACLGDPQRTVAAYRELLRRGESAVSAIRVGLRDANPAVREGCCRLLDHLVDTESMGELVAMTDDPDARVRIAAFHALACDRCKGDTCAPGPDRVLEPALRHLRSDPDPQVRSRAAELVGKFAHSDARAVAALQASHAHDPSRAVRKKSGWYAPGGTIYRRTLPPAAKARNSA
ncbi:HEAT repeat domain-containing protein [Streptomyces sp. YKOK-I1]